jgi:hypothetical protein
MHPIIQVFVRFRIWKDRRDRNLIEYVLMAALAGAIMPGVASGINLIFSQVNNPS